MVDTLNTGNPARRSLLAGAFAAAVIASAATPAAATKWTAINDIVGQTSTATVVGGGDPLYIAPKPQYSGAVGILMDYGGGNAFVCSGSLINSRTVLTAAHCVSDGTSARPLSTTVFFYGGPEDPNVYAAGPGVTTIGVAGISVNPLYTGEVIDENDIAVLRLSDFAPSYAPRYELSGLTDLTGVEHIIAGYGVRSDTGGAVGSNLGTGRLRYAGNRFDYRMGDADFEGAFDGIFGTAAVDHVWLADFDNGTAFRDGSCNLPVALGVSGAVFSTSKYCDTGIGAFEGIGGGGDSGSAYFVDGKVAAVHSFAFWLRDDESNNRFGQLKGSVPVYYHLNFIRRSSLVPEPATWAMMIAGFGLVGGALRRRAIATA